MTDDRLPPHDSPTECAADSDRPHGTPSDRELGEYLAETKSLRQPLNSEAPSRPDRVDAARAADTLIENSGLRGRWWPSAALAAAVLIVAGLVLFNLSGSRVQGEEYVEFSKTDFNTPVLKNEFWKPITPHPDSEAFLRDGGLVLRNRGYLVTTDEFPDGVSVTLRWKWTRGDEKRYDDNLAIAVRCNGRPRREWTHEAEEGLVVKFMPLGQVVSIGLAETKNGRHSMMILGHVQGTGIDLPKDVWHNIKVVDDGKRLTVFLADAPKPLLAVPIPPHLKQSFVAIYNRESVGKVFKESLVDDVVVSVPAKR